MIVLIHPEHGKQDVYSGTEYEKLIKVGWSVQMDKPKRRRRGPNKPKVKVDDKQ